MQLIYKLKKRHWFFPFNYKNMLLSIKKKKQFLKKKLFVKHKFGPIDLD